MTADEGPRRPPTSWVKASDYPHVEVVSRPARVPEEEERADEETSAMFVRQSDLHVAASLGYRDDLEYSDERLAALDAALAGAPGLPGLSFQGLRHPLPPGTLRLRGLLLTTALPGIALVRPDAASRARRPGARRAGSLPGRPHRILAVAGTTGRDAVALAARPVERPVVFRRGTDLRIVGERALGDADAVLDVVLAVDLTDSSGVAPASDDQLWQQVEDALSEAEPPPPGADPWAYLAGSPW
jgi:hypothetical protein